MDRLKGLPSFLFVTAGVLVVLRTAHVVTPVLFPETRQGPVSVAGFDEARRRAGFVPLVPAYRPEALGNDPPAMSVTLSPWPSFTISWRSGDAFLSVTSRRGGPAPTLPPLARPLDDVPESAWWMADGHAHLVVPRADLWITIETSLPPRELRRFLDTLVQGA